MELIANILTKKYIEKNIIDEKLQDMYREGLMLIIADIINISIILLIGVCIRKFAYSVIFLIIFWTVRWFSGGYHAKTYGLCRITTVSSFLMAVLLCEILKGRMQYLSVLFIIITLITILIFSPIKHPNKDLSPQVRQRSKKIALIIAALFSMCSFILCQRMKTEGFIISTTLFIITVLMYAGMLFNREEVKKFEKEIH